VVNVFPSISQEFVRTGKVRIEARVLAFVGPSSGRGRQLLLAAAEQNKAWQLAELIYHNQGDETTS
jgi:protein-disulfide isomerase